MAPWTLLIVGCGDGRDEPAGPACVTDVSAQEGQDLPHGRLFESTCDASASTLICTSPDDEAERHVLSWPDAGTGARIWLHGLLADTRYDCGLDGSGVEGVQTAVEIDGVPLIVPSGDRTRARGYTLFNQVDGGIAATAQRILIVDPEGRTRWSHQVTDEEAKGDVDTQFIPPDRVLYGGGYGANPTLVSLGGDVVWRAPDAPTGNNYHHHARLFDDGNIGVMTNETNSQGGDSWSGFWLALLDPETDSFVWEWSSQQAVDDGALPPGTDDAYHPNSWSYGPSGAVVVSMRNLDRILALDPATGGVLWDMGVNSSSFALVDDQGAPVSDWHYKQHEPEWEGDTVLLYDNGIGRPGGSYTRAARYALDFDTWTATLDWTYSEDGWKENIWGDADRLANGDVLITYGHCFDCGTTSTTKTSSMVQVDPETNAVVWRLDFPREDVGLYRSERIDGCALFHNERYCD